MLYQLCSSVYSTIKTAFSEHHIFIFTKGSICRLGLTCAKLTFIFQRIWVHVLKVHHLSQICVTTTLSPRSCSGRPLECRKNRTKLYTVKYWFLRRFLAPKCTGSSTLGHAERPPGVARSAVGPRHRLGTLRRDVEKCLKTPWVWGIRKNFKMNVFLWILSLRVAIATLSG